MCFGTYGNVPDLTSWYLVIDTYGIHPTLYVKSEDTEGNLTN